MAILGRFPAGGTYIKGDRSAIRVCPGETITSGEWVAIKGEQHKAENTTGWYISVRSGGTIYELPGKGFRAQGSNDDGDTRICTARACDGRDVPYFGSGTRYRDVCKLNDTTEAYIYVSSEIYIGAPGATAKKVRDYNSNYSFQLRPMSDNKVLCVSARGNATAAYVYGDIITYDPTTQTFTVTAKTLCNGTPIEGGDESAYTYCNGTLLAGPGPTIYKVNGTTLTKLTAATMTNEYLGEKYDLRGTSDIDYRIRYVSKKYNTTNDVLHREYITITSDGTATITSSSPVRDAAGAYVISSAPKNFCKIIDVTKGEPICIISGSSWYVVQGTTLRHKLTLEPSINSDGEVHRNNAIRGIARLYTTENAILKGSEIVTSFAVVYIRDNTGNLADDYGLCICGGLDTDYPFRFATPMSSSFETLAGIALNKGSGEECITVANNPHP